MEKRTLVQKIGKVLLPLAFIGALATAPMYAQDISNKISLGEGYVAESQKAYNDLATTDDVLHGLPVNKFIDTYNGVTSITYNVSGSLNRSNISDWNSDLSELAKMADKNHNKDITEKEAEDLLWNAYNFEYKKQDGENK